ncbi:MAG: hypothetical protein R2838_13480 [Caldilineaceae bacterium]
MPEGRVHRHQAHGLHRRGFPLHRQGRHAHAVCLGWPADEGDGAPLAGRPVRSQLVGTRRLPAAAAIAAAPLAFRHSSDGLEIDFAGHAAVRLCVHLQD